jgi:toxin secretion/phage lysis holin
MLPKPLKAVCATAITFFLGLPVAIQLLVYASAIDILAGLISAWIAGTLSSREMYRGLGRKVLALLAVLAAELASRQLGIALATPWGATWSLGALLACYYLIHEALSIIEHLGAAGVPFPSGMRKRLLWLREKIDDQGSD